MTCHLFSVPMPILHHGNLYVKLFGGHEMQVCIAAQASSYERLRTRLNTKQTTQLKDLNVILFSGEFYIKLNNTKRHFKAAQVTIGFSKGAILCRVTKSV